MRIGQPFNSITKDLTNMAMVTLVHVRCQYPSPAVPLGVARPAGGRDTRCGVGGGARAVPRPGIRGDDHRADRRARRSEQADGVQRGRQQTGRDGGGPHGRAAGRRRGRDRGRTRAVAAGARRARSVPRRSARGRASDRTLEPMVRAQGSTAGRSEQRRGGAARAVGDREEQRLVAAQRFISALAAKGPLREGLGKQAAIDITWALTSPEHYQALVAERGWSRARYEHWLSPAFTEARSPRLRSGSRTSAHYAPTWTSRRRSTCCGSTSAMGRCSRCTTTTAGPTSAPSGGLPTRRATSCSRPIPGSGTYICARREDEVT